MSDYVDHSTALQFDRLPPSSQQTEQSLLASMALDVRLIPLVQRYVGRESFYQADHQIIFDVLIEMFQKKIPVDPLTLREELIRRSLFEEVGGASYLAVLLNTVPSAAHGEHYAKVVREKAQLRRMISLSNELLRGAYSPISDDSITSMVQRAQAELASIAVGAAADSVQSLDSILAEVREQLLSGGVPMVPSCFSQLDEEIGGIGLGEVWLIGARPSMGKSTIGKQMLLRAAIAGTPVLWISLEEGRHKIGRNIISAEARIENRKLRRAKFLTQQDWSDIDDSIGRLKGVPFYSTDRARKIEDIYSIASLHKSREGIQMIGIDYLQLVEAGGKGLYEKTTEASKGIARVIRDLNLAGIVPVQLNRALESRDDKRPHMGDLRDSGQIEQDADGIMFLHREDYYHLDDENYEPTGEAELSIAKGRDLARGSTIKLKSELKFQTFSDLRPGQSVDDQRQAAALFGT